MKKMYKIFIAILLISLTQQLFAQPNRDNKREKIQSLRIAVFTEVLNLTPAEAQVFWPLYNEYSQKIRDIELTKKEKNLEIRKNYNSMTEKDFDKVIDEYLNIERKKLDISEIYYDKMKKVIPVKKVFLIPKAERQFKRKLLEIIKERRR
ncbi:MAG: hypothetical protein U9R42_10675 [Bacteroidota bacterium]|nr:hypothetical protein [Bacteroidota bacterium]